MVKPEWGKKYLCQSCGIKYYDLNKKPVACPKCGAEFKPEIVQRNRRSKSSSNPPKIAPVVVKPAHEEGIDLETMEDDTLEDEETVPEDTSDLGGDDDMSDIVDTTSTKIEDS